MREISDNGIRLLSRLEGVSLHVYNDVAALPTIGIGHLLTRSELTSGKVEVNGIPVRYSEGITKLQASALLDRDLKKFEQLIEDCVTVPLDQNQFDALVIFSFNIGRGAFKGSTLLRRLNEGRYTEIPEQLRRWCYASGKKIPGLAARREKEIGLWKGML